MKGGGRKYLFFEKSFRKKLDKRSKYFKDKNPANHGKSDGFAQEQPHDRQRGSKRQRSDITHKHPRRINIEIQK